MCVHEQRSALASPQLPPSFQQGSRSIYSLTEASWTPRVPAAAVATLPVHYQKPLLLLLQGLRVLALATRTMPKVQASFSREDEADLLFQGFLVFLDPPKLSALPAIHQLTKLGINIKVCYHTWGLH